MKSKLPEPGIVETPAGEKENLEPEEPGVTIAVPARLGLRVQMACDPANAVVEDRIERAMAFPAAKATLLGVVGPGRASPCRHVRRADRLP